MNTNNRSETTSVTTSDDLDYFLGLPQIEQLTDAWIKAREGTVTATNVASILELNEHSSKLELFNKKLKTDSIPPIISVPEKVDLENDPTSWGQTFEGIAQRLTEYRYNVSIHDLGLKFHDNESWLGASPDGISKVSPALENFIAQNAEAYLRQNNTSIPKMVLFEFKCPIWRKITRQIPFNYWVQMQIQMEVWGLDSCMYSEHKFMRFKTKKEYEQDASIYKGLLEDTITNEIIYWKEEEYWDQIVFRDTEWFKKILPTIKSFYNLVQEHKKTGDINNQQVRPEQPAIIQQQIDFQTVNWDEFRHTQDITNFILEDPLLDWLNKYGQKSGYEFVKRDKQSPYSLPNFVLEKYLEFREHVSNYLKYHYPKDYKDIANDPFFPDPDNMHYQLLIKYQSRSTRNLNRTLEALRSGIPIIMNGLVYHPEKKTYGRIDLLIRKDWLEKVFQKRPILESENWTPLPNILVETSPDVFMVDTAKEELKKKKATRQKKTRSVKQKDVERARSKKQLELVAQKRKLSEIDDGSNKRKRRRIIESSTEESDDDNDNNDNNDNKKSNFGPIADYVMVQIKYASVNLTANGLNLLNNQKQKIYKGHSTLLNESLGYMLGKTPKRSFILGRKSSFKSKGQTFKTDSFLNSLGVIDYEKRDLSYIKLYNEALEWVCKLRSEGGNWNFADETMIPSIEYLYPNMKNDRDYPWHGTKKEIAEKVGELTSLLYLGVDKRKQLHQKKIYSINHLTPEIIDENKLRQGQVLKNMLESTRNNRIINLENIDHSVINSGRDVEFYVDFETVSDLQDDFTQLPWTGGHSLIYMVGCYAKNNLTGESFYYNYLVDHLTPDCERKMIRDWINDMEELVDQVEEIRKRYETDKEDENEEPPVKRRRLKKKYSNQDIVNVKLNNANVKLNNANVKLNNVNRNRDSKTETFPSMHIFHWSQAEKTHLNRALEEHASDILINYELDMIDLYDHFKDNHVALPGLFRYGLKDVSKLLYKMGEMRTIWPDDLDGSQAMVAAWRAEEVAKSENKTLSEIDFMEPIIRYNFVDCKALDEIVEYLRRNIEN